ncbi:MAG: hypothetical protein WC028_16810 [Candidatus Obscuribacterales bacterium]
MVKELGALSAKCLSQNLGISNQYFKSDIQQLNKERALELIASLNIATTDLLGANERASILQLNALRLLNQDGLIAHQYCDRLNALLSDKQQLKFYEALVFFHRTHAFEMYRAISLWSQEHSHAGVFATDLSPNRTQLIRSILMSHDLFLERTPFPDLSRETPELMFPFLRTFRLQSLMSPVGNPLTTLGRADLLMDKYFFNLYPKYKDVFERSSGMSLEDYRHCATAILAATGHTDPTTLSTIWGVYDFTISSLTEGIARMRGPFESYLALESITTENLSNQYAGQTTMDHLTLRPLRGKPILKMTDDRYILLDLQLLTERATYGPLFYIQEKDRFIDFGNAFERYVLDLFQRNYSSWGLTREPISRHLVISEINEPIPQDLILSKDDACVLVEIKGAWLNDDKIAESATEFWEEVCKKYCDDGKVSGKRKGVGQLSYTIRGVIDGLLKEPSAVLSLAKKIFPVLLVHDRHLVLPWFGHFIAKEFWRHFEIDLPSSGFAIYAGRKIFSPIVISLIELENLETIGKQANLINVLEDYSLNCGDRVQDFRAYLLKYEATGYCRNIDRGKEMLDEMRERFWPTNERN